MSEHTASLHLNPLVPLYVCTTADRYQRTEHDLSAVTHYLARSSLPPPHRPLPHCCCARALPSVQPPFITSCSSTCISSPLFNDHTPNRPLQISRVSVLWKHTPHLARAGSHLCPHLLISLITFCSSHRLPAPAAQTPPPRHPCRLSSTAILKRGFSFLPSLPNSCPRVKITTSTSWPSKLLVVVAQNA